MAKTTYNTIYNAITLKALDKDSIWVLDNINSSKNIRQLKVAESLRLAWNKKWSIDQIGHLYDDDVHLYVKLSNLEYKLEREVEHRRFVLLRSISFC